MRTNIVPVCKKFVCYFFNIAIKMNTFRTSAIIRRPIAVMTIIATTYYYKHEIGDVLILALIMTLK